MARSVPEKKLTPVHDWRTTDDDEIDRRRLRARDEAFTIVNTEARHPIFSNFRVASGSGLTYNVEIRDLRERQWACDCVDFRINGQARGDGRLSFHRGRRARRAAYGPRIL